MGAGAGGRGQGAGAHRPVQDEPPQALPGRGPGQGAALGHELQQQSDGRVALLRGLRGGDGVRRLAQGRLRRFRDDAVAATHPRAQGSAGGLRGVLM